VCARRDPVRRDDTAAQRTFARLFEKIDAEAFKAALYGCLISLPATNEQEDTGIGWLATKDLEDPDRPAVPHQDAPGPEVV
jgi:hypothetical protein